MKEMNWVLEKTVKHIASLALVMGVSTINSTGCYWIHQPKVPEGMEKFKK